MIESVEEIYNHIEFKHLNKDYNSVTDFLKKLKIKYKIKRME